MKENQYEIITDEESVSLEISPFVVKNRKEVFLNISLPDLMVAAGYNPGKVNSEFLVKDDTYLHLYLGAVCSGMLWLDRSSILAVGHIGYAISLEKPIKVSFLKSRIKENIELHIKCKKQEISFDEFWEQF